MSPHDVLEAMGWESRRAHFYNEEAVEGWVWEHETCEREYEEVGSHDEPAPVPDALLALL